MAPRPVVEDRMLAPLNTSERKKKLWSVVRVSSGNFLEMYDFMVFGYYASAIGATFFPSGIPFVSLMLSLMTFGAGFLMRPLGAIVLGAYTDVHGRRKGLILTLTLMSFGIVTIACTPGYATISVLAPIPPPASSAGETNEERARRTRQLLDRYHRDGDQPARAGPFPPEHRPRRIESADQSGRQGE